MKLFAIGFVVGAPVGVVAARLYWAKAITLGHVIYEHAEKDWEKAMHFLANVKRLLPRMR